VDEHERQHRLSLADPRRFWAEAAADIAWSTPFRNVIEGDSAPGQRWFQGGALNTCYNALDLHADGERRDQPALIYDSPLAHTQQTFSFRELREAVARFAGGLQQLGIAHGDRVLVYMPMVPEALIGMLACARLGAIHSVVFGGFAAPELAKRIADAQPRAILSASCGLEPGRVIAYKPILDQAIALSGACSPRCVILQRPQSEASLGALDIPWQQLAEAEPVGCRALDANDPLYILYTSGTTGVPKGVVRDNGGHAVALKWSMRNVYGVRPGEVFWAASDIGWAVGHSYTVYAPLLLGCTTVLYEGKPVGTPDAGAFWRVVEEHRVNVLFTAPTSFRAIRREDPEAKLLACRDLSSLRALFLAGERADPATLAWAEEKLQVPIIDHYWQTETGWPVAANCLGIERLPVKHGSPAKPVPGYDVVVLDEAGVPLSPGEIGNIAIKLPLPPGCFPTLWNNEQGYLRTYFERYPGYYETADAGFLDEDGYLFVMARTDDIINVAGHRLSTGGIEEILAGHPDVAECAVIGVSDALKGQVPVGLCVLSAAARREPGSVERELVARVREQLGAVASLRRVLIVARLPKTRSGKILRKAMRKIADGEPVSAPATIDDPAILDEIARVFADSRPKPL
jgi:propionyl-CoA synthetase